MKPARQIYERSFILHKAPNNSKKELLRNLVIGLTTSFVALSLGASLGILSGRGAFAGMFSAGIIALITSILGGTRVQCSGPTAPMSAVSAVVVAFAVDNHFDNNHFINITFALAGAILIIMGILRVGRFITLVPNVVVSGFMSGIAVLIWQGQLETLFGFGGKEMLQGSLTDNLSIVLATLIIISIVPKLLGSVFPAIASFIPSTLLAIIAVSFAANLMSLPVGYVDIHATISSFKDLSELISKQFPSDISANYIIAAFPFALQLAVLCYLDTLLTSLVVDKMSREKTKQNKELVAQGVANTAVAIIGGIPGAQATIRSVLMIKEGATLRVAGIFVGIFVILEMLLFQHAIGYIPQAVFVGILLKVGYDVFDFLPIRLYLNELFKGKIKLTENIFRRHKEETIFVTNMEMLFIIGTILVTVLIDLNMAVIGFSLLFYIVNKWIIPHKPLRDLAAGKETDLLND